MTIDQRIEALTQSVELLAQIHRDNEQKYEQRFQHLESLITRVVSVSESLAAIASNHEQRIKDLET